MPDVYKRQEKGNNSTNDGADKGNPFGRNTLFLDVYKRQVYTRARIYKRGKKKLFSLLYDIFKKKKH